MTSNSILQAHIYKPDFKFHCDIMLNRFLHSEMLTDIYDNNKHLEITLKTKEPHT